MIQDAMDFVSQFDPEVGEAIRGEYTRECRNIELIASENLVSEAVMLAMGSCTTQPEPNSCSANAVTCGVSASSL